MQTPALDVSILSDVASFSYERAGQVVWVQMASFLPETGLNLRGSEGLAALAGPPCFSPDVRTLTNSRLG